MLGINDQRAVVLASLLRWQRVPATEIVVGDVVVTDHAAIEVAEVERRDGLVWVYDIDRNRHAYHDWEKADAIARDCLDHSGPPVADRIAQQREIDAEFRSMYPETP